jgi:hypothetical protein
MYISNDFTGQYGDPGNSGITPDDSIRATGATMLEKSMFNPSRLMAVTGHKSAQSLTVYQRTDIEEKINI